MPLLFSSNRGTYARYMTVQLLQMKRLPSEVEDGFNKGLFTGKLSDGKFNNLLLDYTVEVTQNKALNGSGGIIGLTLRENALARWFLARPLSSTYSSIFHGAICPSNNKDTDQRHHTDTKSCRDKHEKMIGKLSKMFEGTFLDPFDTKTTTDCLINFAIGAHAEADVETS